MNEFFSRLGQFKENSKGMIPSVSNTNEFLESLLKFLFPVITESKQQIDSQHQYKSLIKEFEVLLCSINYSSKEAKVLSISLMSSMPVLYQKIIEDADAIYQGDPAALSKEEVILTYPGFLASAVYRIAHELYLLNIPLIPRIMSEYAHRTTGIEIHPGASIGRHFCIDHGSGVVIGQTAVVGNRVKIYQGVTLGALSVNKKDCKSKRHPTIEDEVTIYAGASILGGETVIGHHSVIGGNVWLVKGVLPYSKVIHNSQITVIEKKRI